MMMRISLFHKLQVPSVKMGNTTNKACRTATVLLLIAMQGLLKPSLVTCNYGTQYGCPARALITPCACNEITKGLEIVCEGVQAAQLREVFENVQQTGQTLVYLKMKNNPMSTFPALLLSNIDVRHLMAHKCSIANVHASAFSGLESKIESIDFSENKFTQIPSEALKELVALISLNLNFNQIESIHENAFQGLDSLLRLSLFGNKIVRIHENAFVGVGFNLTRVNLGGNELTSIPSKALRVLKSIQRFQIHENHIRTLRKSDLTNLQSSDHLDVLNLAHNSISVLEENVFLDLRTLNSLDFESNQIATVHPNAFNGIHETLEWLKLGENKLKEIPSSALQNLIKLRELDLRGNLIQRVKRDSFQKFGENIKFLYLQKNRIETIEEGALESLRSLEWLNLHSNSLKHIDERLFLGLMSHLVILDLHDNPIECTCGIMWYQEWIEHNNKHQMKLVSAETKCNLRAGNDSGKQVQVLMETLAQHLKCNAFRASLGPLFVTLMTVALGSTLALPSVMANFM